MPNQKQDCSPEQTTLLPHLTTCISIIDAYRALARALNGKSVNPEMQAVLDDLRADPAVRVLMHPAVSASPHSAAFLSGLIETVREIKTGHVQLHLLPDSVGICSGLTMVVCTLTRAERDAVMSMFFPGNRIERYLPTHDIILTLEQYTQVACA